jgi:nucleoside-diphosphate-sugar epimerase
VHNEAFNVGSTQENYQIRDVASLVEKIVPGSRVKYAEGGGPDLRCYRVNCDKIARLIPEFRPQWTVRRGIKQLYTAYAQRKLTIEEFTGERFTRIKHLRDLLTSSRIDAALRWQR